MIKVNICAILFMLTIEFDWNNDNVLLLVGADMFGMSGLVVDCFGTGA